MNDSGMEPLGYRVIIKPDVRDETYKGSSIVIPEDARNKYEIAETEGVIVAVGPSAWQEEVKAGQPPDAKVGDRVVFSQHAGQLRRNAEGVRYRIINDHDVIAVTQRA